MVAKKGKKKVASNPARGFATTSIASKPKPERKDADTSNEPSEKPSSVSTPAAAEKSPQPGQQAQGQEQQASNTNKASGDRELHELSPEELEARLDLSELQSFIEQQGPKVRKESARQVLRLKTDRRVLRGQADLLNIREWLPEELMQQIVDLALDETSSISATSSTPANKRLSQDDLLSKVWQLSITLADLDIDEDQVRKVLQFILVSPPTEDNGGLIWGLSEALDWLALNSAPGQLLDYDAIKPKPQLSSAQFNDGKLVSPAFLTTHITVPFLIAPDNEPSEPATPSKPSGEQTPKKAAPAPSNQTSQPSDTPVDDIQVSDVESDLDPDEMLSTYLRTKLRLYERNPLLVNDSTKKPKKQQGNGTPSPRKATPGESKLQQRLKSIESDVLFDKGLADVRWIEGRNQILQNQTERKRFNLAGEAKAKKESDENSNNTPRESATDDVMAEAEAAAQQLLDEMGEDDEMLGGMFGEATEGASNGNTSGQAENADPDLTVRNFGKITGISPRRTFEEACRSRDSGAKVSYKMVSSTTYNSRHSVIVHWSKDQDIIDGSFTPDVNVVSSDRRTMVTMARIACPETLQSEGYVSTVALFLLFSNSPKEEKSALRLPPTFRDLWTELVDARQEKRDTADRETVRSLREMVKGQTEEDGDEDVILTAGFRNRNKGLSGVSTPVGDKIEKTTKIEESQALRDLWARKTSTPAYQEMLLVRSSLPMFQFRDIALDAVEKNQVTILCGETGCGKSTQMPAFILEHELSLGRPCKIYCTEPRRISAISLAQRVSEEMGEDKKAVGTARSLVGYAIRLESMTTAQTRLVYATVGIVLRMLESTKGFDEVTHLVIDEIHERSIDTDFLLIVLRALMIRRPDLKVVLMSATVDAQRFSSYLDNAPIVTVPGRTFPVAAKYLEDAIELTGHTIEDGSPKTADADEDDLEAGSSEATIAAAKQLTGYSPKTVRTLAGYDEYAVDYTLIVKLLEKIAYDPSYTQFSQAVLVFLPGLAEIRSLNDFLGGHPAFSKGWLVYPLHSSFSSEEQQAAFKIPPPGMRKIVLATNIAETGITIPDVTAVIDTGKHKEMRFDERRQLSRLIQSFISRANAKQRRGRAGRVQEGVCFHLFTKYRHDEIMAPQQTPEMLRLSLQDLVMRVKICKLGDIEQALSQALDPPSLKNIRRAIDALIDVGALTSSEELTPLGNQLAKLPLDAQLGKLILLSSVFGCLDFALSVAATLSSKTPFVAPMGAKKQADTVRLGFKRGNSDLLTAYNAYCAWRKACTTPGISEQQFCRKNFLSPINLGNIEDLKSQLLASLSDAGFVSLESGQRAALSRVRNSGRGPRAFVAVPASHNTFDANDALLNAVTAWSFYPKLAVREGKGWRNVANSQSLSLHPQSVNKLSPSLTPPSYLSFYSIMQSNSRFTNAQETAPVDPFVLTLLAGDAKFDLYAGVVVIDGNRLRFKVASWRTAFAVKVLRSKVKEFLAREFRQPGRSVVSERQRAWMRLFGQVFENVEAGRVR
ncbi:ATP-dependent RNA helicase A, partial [Aureobasidium sp. EXF-3399]